MRVSAAVWDKKTKISLVFFSLMLSFGVFSLAATIFARPDGAPALSVRETGGTLFVIDAGHGFPDGGASSRDGVLESGINLQIARRVEAAVRFVGGNTLMTRTDENSIHDPSAGTIREKKRSDLKNRVSMINGQPDALLISIHQNFFTDQKYSGAQVFYAGDELSEELGKTLQKALSSALGAGNTRSAAKVPSSVYLFNRLECPGILIECGFLSNDGESRLLQQDGHQKKIAVAIAACLLSFGTEG